MACSCQEKDVVVDCLLWLLRSQWRDQISSRHSHTSSSSRNNTTTTHAGSTRSCYDVKRKKNEQCCNSFLLQILCSFVCEGEFVVWCAFAYCWTRLSLWKCITKCNTIIFCQDSINDQILCHEGVWQYPTWISLCGDYSIESSRWILWFKFPNRFSEISCLCRDLTSLFKALFSLLLN